MRTSILAASFLALLFAVPVCRARGRAEATRLIATESSQAIQNERANAFHLSRLRDLSQVHDFASRGFLVSVPPRTSSYYLEDVPPDYSYLRPWAKVFLDRLSRDYYARFGQPLRITSLLRTVELQRQLTRWNPNAAQAVGADRSSHLTGATLDISKHDMNWSGMQWLRLQLFQLKRQGYLYAVEEFHEPCFHVMVFPIYRGDVQPAATPSLRPVRHRMVRRRVVRRSFARRRRRLHRAHRHLQRPSTPSAQPASPAQPAPAIAHPVASPVAPAPAPARPSSAPVPTEPVTVKTLGDVRSAQ